MTACGAAGASRAALALLLAIATIRCGGGPSLGATPVDEPAEQAEAAGAAAPAMPPAARHRGVAWVGGRRPVTSEDLSPLVEANVRWIAQTPFGWQRGENTPEVRLIPSGHVYWGETDEGLAVTTRLARERGIETMLKPHLWLSAAGEGVWHGDIAMESEEDWQRWFASYRRLALHYARLAERLDIPLYCVGTELHATVRARPGDWRRLIADVRKVYSGQLTYAANWHDEIHDVSFWDALDLIGVQAYFPLGEAAQPSVDDLVAGWQPHLATLDALATRHRRPVLFTEVGYLSRPGATKEPWVWPEHHGDETATAAGLELQARAYEAFFRVYWDRPWIAGAYFWKWYPGRPPGVESTVDFTPQGKPAELVLRRWFGRSDDGV
jgi:hypothetical protein